MDRRGLAYFLQDILAAIASIERFLTGVDFEAFVANEEKVTAVIKKIEIIGEAVEQVPEEVRSDYPEIPWKAIAGMRDLLVHTYWKTDLSLIWQVVQSDLPVLNQVVVKILADQEKR
jgi:uncharacterized protein with HEPN domain